MKVFGGFGFFGIMMLRKDAKCCLAGPLHTNSLLLWGFREFKTKQRLWWDFRRDVAADPVLSGSALPH